jgi:hypothetical protein
MREPGRGCIRKAKWMTKQNIPNLGHNKLPYPHAVFINIVSFLQMSATLLPTNMTKEEMVPDTLDPTYDLQYWCLPPQQDEPSEKILWGNFPMYLVMQGRKVGVWHDWWF